MKPGEDAAGTTMHAVHDLNDSYQITMSCMPGAEVPKDRIVNTLLLASFRFV